MIMVWRDETWTLGLHCERKNVEHEQIQMQREGWRESQWVREQVKVKGPG